MISDNANIRYPIIMTPLQIKIFKQSKMVYP